MRRLPAARSITSPESLSTLRCCETAGRLTGSSRASSPPGRRRRVMRRTPGAARRARPYSRGQLRGWNAQQLDVRGGSLVALDLVDPAGEVHPVGGGGEQGGEVRGGQ